MQGHKCQNSHSYNYRRINVLLYNQCKQQGSNLHIKLVPIGSRLQSFQPCSAFELIWKDWDKCAHGYNDNNNNSNGRKRKENKNSIGNKSSSGGCVLTIPSILAIFHSTNRRAHSYLMYYAQSIMKGHSYQGETKCTATTSKVLIHYLAHIPQMRIREVWGKMKLNERGSQEPVSRSPVSCCC